MSNRFAMIVILAEDERSANLLRRYAIRALDINNRRIRQVISPAGRGDAKRWILGQYPNVPPPSLPSLATAIPELWRLEM